MGTIRITGPDGRTARITVPDGASEAAIQAKISEVKANWPSAKPTAPAQPQPSWWQRNITGVRPQGEENTPNVNDVEDFRSASNVGAMVFGASDAQLADNIKSQLGDRFVRQEQDANGYPIVVWKGEDGQEKRGYVNNPGLDAKDIGRSIFGALPYAATGAAGVAAGVGRGLLANAGLQGVAAAGTSIAGDVAQSAATGSEQGIEGEKAAFAGGFGAAGPIVGRGIGNAAEYIANQFRNTPAALQPFRRGAVNRVMDSVDADRITPQIAAQRAADLGPEGALADYGPNVQAQTAGLARTQGENKRIVTDMLNARGEMAPARINNDLNHNLGYPANIEATQQGIRQHYNQAAQPFYDDFYSREIPVDENLVGLLQAVPDSVWPRVQEMMRMERLDPAAIANTGRGIDLIKRALDDTARSAPPNSNQQRLFSNLARDIRNHVDTLLSPQNPAESPWAQARAIAGDGFESREALERGSTIFSRQEDPVQLRGDMAGMSQEAQEMLRAGGRSDLRGLAGRSATAYRANGDTRVRRALNSDFNRENIRTIAPSGQAADNILRRIDAETAFAETNDLAQRNSVTSTMQAAQRTIPGAREAEMDIAGEAAKKGPIGLATEGAVRLANMLAGGALNRRNEALRTDMARMLVAQGANRDRIVNALMDIRNRRGVNAERGAQIDRIVRALTVGATQPLAAALAD